MTNATLPLARVLASDPWVAAAIPALSSNGAMLSPSAWAELLLVVGVASRRIAADPSWEPLVRHRNPGSASFDRQQLWRSERRSWHHQWRGAEVADALEIAAAAGVLGGFSRGWALRSPSIDLARLVLGDPSDELALKFALWMERSEQARRWPAVMTVVHQLRPLRVARLVAVRPALTRALHHLPGCSHISREGDSRCM